jgi:hypothetical protein
MRCPDPAKLPTLRLLSSGDLIEATDPVGIIRHVVLTKRTKSGWRGRPFRQDHTGLCSTPVRLHGWTFRKWLRRYYDHKFVQSA